MKKTTKIVLIVLAVIFMVRNHNEPQLVILSCQLALTKAQDLHICFQLSQAHNF